MKLKQGFLIAIEGIDGSGKSTLSHNLFDSLKKEFSVLLTKEPGATELGKQLRPILQERKVLVCNKAEYLLFAADRAQHFEQVIIPNLKACNIIISDRLADSSLVYQGYGRGLDKSMIRTINTWAMNNIKPDITFYIRVPLDIAWQRLKNRKQLTSFEQEEQSFTKKLVHGFDVLYKDRKDVTILDGTKLPQTIANKAIEIIKQWITKNNLIG